MSKNPVFKKFLLKRIAMKGDVLQKFGWAEPPITNFRLKNILTGSHYQISKTKEIKVNCDSSLNLE